MRDITFPSRLFNRGLRGLTRQLFLEAYEVSDDTFWQQQGEPDRWRSLGGLVEFADDFLAVAHQGAGVDDLVARDQALAEGNLLEALGPEIKKSWELYKEKVTPEVANSSDHFRDALNDILVRHTGKSMEDVQKDTDRDNFMSGMEAKSYGIVDHVITDRDDLDKISESEE